MFQKRFSKFDFRVYNCAQCDFWAFQAISHIDLYSTQCFPQIKGGGGAGMLACVDPGVDHFVRLREREATKNTVKSG